MSTEASHINEGDARTISAPPKGAMQPQVSSLPYNQQGRPSVSPSHSVSDKHAGHPANWNEQSPPVTPGYTAGRETQVFLPGNKSEGPKTPKTPAATAKSKDGKAWIPIPLRWYFWVPLVVVLVAGGIGLEVARKITNDRQGWSAPSGFGSEAGVIHYVYTLPPVAVAAFLVAMWAWTDIEVKKMQPYVDLVHGDSHPERSLLLDYTRSNNFWVWTHAATNKHYLVALTSLMALLCLAFQPLAAALLVLRDTWWTLPDRTLNNLAAIGLNQDAEFTQLTGFLNAAGFAAAAMQTNLSTPFVFGQYAIPEFELPTDVLKNGTVVFVNTTAVKSDPGCRPVQVNMQNHTDGSGWTNSASAGDGCSATWVVDTRTVSPNGVDTANCTNPVPEQFQPVIFWFFTYQPSAMSSATFCYPSITLWDVSVSLDLASGNVIGVTELQPFTSSSNFSSLSGNVTGAPLNGRAYNGIRFNLTDPDPFVVGRNDAIRTIMPNALFTAATRSAQGLVGSFNSDVFVTLSAQVYTKYLTLIAQLVYFLPTQEPNTIRIKTVRKRLFLSDVAVHLLATAMILLGIFAVIIHLLHRHDREVLRLHHAPGTIASAVAIGGKTGLSELLGGAKDDKQIAERIHNERFGWNPIEHQIVIKGRDGYEDYYAQRNTPTAGDGIFASQQGQRPLSGLRSRLSMLGRPAPRSPPAQSPA